MESIYTPHVLACLTKANTEARLKTAEWFFAHNSLFFKEKVIWTDEKYFVLYQGPNKFINKIWAPTNPYINVQCKTQSQQKGMSSFSSKSSMDVWFQIRQKFPGSLAAQTVTHWICCFWGFLSSAAARKLVLWICNVMNVLISSEIWTKNCFELFFIVSLSCVPKFPQSGQWLIMNWLIDCRARVTPKFSSFASCAQMTIKWKCAMMAKKR